MEIQVLINKEKRYLENEPLFQKYFNGIEEEEGIDVKFFLNRKLGIDIIISDKGYSTAIHFYSKHHKDIEEFKDELPFSLMFSYSQNKAREMLGIPNFVGEEGFSFLYGTIPPWDKYIYSNFSLHVQFTVNREEISLVTIEALNPDYKGDKFERSFK